MPEVSVILLNFNGGDLTCQAIDSLLNQVGTAPEIIVIDNGSTDGSAERIAARYQDRIVMLKNSGNRGFSPACNQGFEIAKSEWIALMNNDAVADPFWLSRSLAKAKTNPGIGVVMPRILQYFDREKLDGIGVGFWLDGISRARRRGQLDGARFNSDHPQILSGCACLLSKKMIEELSGFDPSFFAYSEDTDLGIRAILAGWESAYEPEAVVFHMYSSTSSAKTRYSPMKLYYVERNRIWILLRYYPWSLILVSPFTSLWRYLYLASQVISASGKGGGLGAGSAILALIRAIYGALASFGAQMEIRKKWRASPAGKKLLREIISGNRLPLKEIARLD